MDLFNVQLVFAAFSPWQWIKDMFIALFEWLYQLTVAMGIPNWVLATFLFTVIVKVLTQPLQNKQLRSTRKMQLLQPEIDQLKKRYANNPQKLQQEQMKLYKENGCSPTAGCLPMLVQMPIIIALFQALREYVPPEGVSFSFMWLENLSMPDPTWILPILTGASQLLQSWLTTSKSADKNQKMMMYMMPVMFLFFVRSFPALLAFYWIFYSLVGAAITWPLLRYWGKKDQAAISAVRAAKEEEEDRRRAKKAAARQRAKEQSKQKKPAYDAYLEDTTIDVDGEDSELDDDDEENPEVAFQKWMVKKGIQVKRKKMRLHPWSPEDEVVELGVLPSGKEVDLDTLRQQYRKIMDQEAAQAQMESSAIGQFLKKRKDKQAQKKEEE